MTWPNGRLDLVDGEWRWRGGAVAMVRESDLIDGSILTYDQWFPPQAGTVLQCGDYQVRVLRETIPDFRLFVALNTWYVPFIVFVDKLRRSANLTKIFIIRLALIWGIAVYPGEGARYDDWDLLRPVRWVQQLLRGDK